MSFPDLSKPVDRMTKMELRMLLQRKDEELADLRNRLAQIGPWEANTAQLSAALALMREVIHERQA